MPCPLGMHYSTCKPSCIPTCQNPSAPANCAGACTEGCFCDDGLVLKDGVCITYDQCGCKDQNNYYRQVQNSRKFFEEYIRIYSALIIERDRRS